jgi:hypothetical protein
MNTGDSRACGRRLCFAHGSSPGKPLCDRECHSTVAIEIAGLGDGPIGRHKTQPTNLCHLRPVHQRDSSIAARATPEKSLLPSPLNSPVPTIAQVTGSFLIPPKSGKQKLFGGFSLPLNLQDSSRDESVEQSCEEVGTAYAGS